MPQPLPEPSLLVSDNCSGCGGTGMRSLARTQRPGEGDGALPCEDCEGSGREVRELPLSAAWDLAHRQHSELTAPPPSMVREQALAADDPS